MADFDTFWDYGNPAKTESKFLEILEQSDCVDNESYVGQLYTQLARTHSLRGNWEDAHTFLNKAKTLLAKADKVTEVRYQLELGRTYNSSGEKVQAIEVLNPAWTLAQGIQADHYAVDAAHMLAIAVDDRQTALDWNRKALEYANQSIQPKAKKWLGSLYNNIGWTYFDDNDYLTALDMFEKALIVREKQKEADNIRTAKWCIARVQRELGQVETALQTQLALLAEYEALNRVDEYVFEELAHCYATLSDTKNAATYAKLAHGLLSKDEWMVKNEPSRLKTLVDLM